MPIEYSQTSDSQPTASGYRGDPESTASAGADYASAVQAAYDTAMGKRRSDAADLASTPNLAYPGTHSA